MSSPVKRTDSTRRRPLPTPAAACSASVWKKTASPGSSPQPMMSRLLRLALVSGKSARRPPGNHFASFDMKDRGISQGPRCEPLTNSRIAARETGPIGAHIAGGYGVGLSCIRPKLDFSYDGRQLACLPLADPQLPQVIVLAHLGRETLTPAAAFLELARRSIADAAGFAPAPRGVLPSFRG